MNRTICVALIWCVSVSCGIASGQDKPDSSADAAAPTDEVQAVPAEYDPAKVVVSVVNFDAKRSEVILSIVDALEKAGIERSDAPADQNWNDDRITARIRVRVGTPYEKITALVKAMQYAGVQKFSLTNPTADGKNLLFLVANTPQPTDDRERIEHAAKHSAEENDLQLDVFSTIPAMAMDNATTPKTLGSPLKSAPSTFDEFREPAFADLDAPRMPFNNGTYLPAISDPESSTISAETLRDQITDLKKEYEGNDKRAHELVESLRKTPDAMKKSELKSTVMRALRSRQELLQADLLLMQYRLNEAQENLTQRIQIRTQIVDRRVLDLLNPELDREGSKLINSPKDSNKNVASTPSTPATPQKPVLKFTPSHKPNPQIPQWENRSFPGPFVTIAVQRGEVDGGGWNVANGLVVSETGLILVHSVEKSFRNPRQVHARLDVHVRPDDRLRYPLVVAEKSDCGLLALKPKKSLPGKLTQFWPLSSEEYSSGDEVTVLGLASARRVPFQWSPSEITQVSESDNLGLSNTWQVRRSNNSFECNAVLSKDMKKLIGIPVMRSSLAKGDYHVIPVTQLNSILPNTFGPLATKSPLIIPKPTELEGDWHQVAYSDGEGDTHEKHIYNRTFNGNLSIIIWSSGSSEDRIEVDSTAKIIRRFGDKGNGYVKEPYKLQGDRLVILEPGFVEGDRITVYERGHIPFSTDDRLIYAAEPEAE